MKKSRIVIGVLSILIGFLVLVESYDVFRLANVFGVNGFHIYVGFLVGLIFIALGVLSIVLLVEQWKKYVQITIPLSLIAISLCFEGPKIFSDLLLFAVWGVICLIYTLLIYVKYRKNNNVTEEKTISQIANQTTCPYCHAVIDGSSMFCGSCGKKIQKECPCCGSLIVANSAFCGNCGKKVEEVPSDAPVESTQKKCPHCGTPVNDGNAFCENCGMNLAEIIRPQLGNGSNIDYRELLTKLKKFVPYVVGLILLAAIIWGSFYGYEEYSAYRARKEAREKFVADSLEKVRQDSIKLAAKLEAERIEKEKIAKFREKFTFNNILNLLRHPDDASLAQKCGLSFIYKDSEREEGYEDGQYFTHYDYVYGYEVEKGKRHDVGMGYDIKASSNHSCYFRYREASDIMFLFRFKDESDAEYLFEMAKDYGLIESGGYYYIPEKKIPKGITHVEKYEAYGSSAQYQIRILSNVDGWYEVYVDYCY